MPGVRSKRLIATAREEISNVTTTDIALMREAIALAAEADAPFGAVIVKDGRVLARGRNSVKRLKDPTVHGEMVAIRHCLAEHGPEILRGATIYTSGEPCPMCMGRHRLLPHSAGSLWRVDRRAQQGPGPD